MTPVAQGLAYGPTSLIATHSPAAAVVVTLIAMTRLVDTAAMSRPVVSGVSSRPPDAIAAPHSALVMPSVSTSHASPVLGLFISTPSPRAPVDASRTHW